jgi:hypothetical protein
MGVVLVSGSSWSVDIAGTLALLGEIDVDAEAFCTAAADVEDTGDGLASILHGSSTVRSALAAFLSERDTVPSRVVGRVKASTAAVTSSVEGIAFAEEEMTAANTAPVADKVAQFYSDRFSSGPVPR